MLIQKYNSIMQKNEANRNKWALGLTFAFSLLIFVSFGFYKGYINLGNQGVVAQKESAKQVASAVSADSASSPLDNSKKALGAAFSEIGKQYDLFKESISSVLVPFVTSIEVYDNESQ